MSSIVKGAADNQAFLGCDSERAECAIPHAAAGADAGPAAVAQAIGGPEGGDSSAPPAAAVTPAEPRASDDGTQVAVREAPRAPEAPPLAEAEGCSRLAHQASPWSPERPVMEILFRCIEAGRRYYGVRLNGQEIFVGTRSECDRFLKIHEQKVSEEQAEARRVPRGRPAQLRIYRTLRA